MQLPVSTAPYRKLVLCNLRIVLAIKILWIYFCHEGPPSLRAHFCADGTHALGGVKKSRFRSKQIS